MPEIVAASTGKFEMPEKAFAVTFDDGFANNYSIAAPILRSFNVPATFYITTDFIVSNAMSWIDMIEYAVENTDKRHFNLAGTNNLIEIGSKKQKIDLLEEIRQIVKNDHKIDPIEFASNFCSSLGISDFNPDPSLDLKMTWEQVFELHNDPLFTIGGHTHTHRNMAFLDLKELREEISVSLELLKENLKCKIEHYSYPEGLSNCYSDNVIDELKKQGIICCPTAELGTNSKNDDLFRLKRIPVV
ncbi:MAG: polysaccharide deacetylase family protein [Methanomicrobiaceae archaeon]|nr:polysaccharide deacetylase family protein [Methanomicrobiaceae archaeon]